MEIFEDLIGVVIFELLLWVLQQLGAIVRWAFSRGNCPFDHILKNKFLNGFIGILIIAAGVGLTSL